LNRETQPEQLVRREIVSTDAEIIMKAAAMNENADTPMNTVAIAKIKRKFGRMIEPWSVKHFADRSEIEAYVLGTGSWKSIAEVKQAVGVEASNVADFIVRAVNEFEGNQQLIKDMIAALETCIGCVGIDWATENNLETILRHAKAVSRVSAGS
jgi:hypothetical protein